MGLKLCSFALVFALVGPKILAQPMTQALMHAKVQALYSFSPHALTKDQRSAKSAEMDKFWQEVKESSTSSLLLLRVELRDKSNPPFFMEDGSELLTSLSKDKGDHQLAADASANCDLADVNSGAYFFRIHALSMEGVDTTKASLHILDAPAFSVPLPQHAMTLDRSMALVYLLLPLPADEWMGAARARFQSEHNESVQKSLLALFFYAQTKEADAALEAAAHDSSNSDTVRKDAAQHQQDVKNVLASKHAVKDSEATIRAARQKRLGAVSDESIGDVQQMTAELMLVRSRAH